METVKKLVQWIVDLETSVQRQVGMLEANAALLKKKDSIITRLEKELADAKQAR